MSNQKKNINSHISTSILILVYCIGWSIISYADETITSVQVSFKLERDETNGQAKPILDALDSKMERELVEEFKAEAVTYCSTQFPYLEWKGTAQTEATSDFRARLEILMKAKQGIGWEVYLQSTTILDGSPVAEAKATVYDANNFLPERKNELQEDIKNEIFKDSVEALIKLIPNGSDLIKVIPLTNTIHVDPDGHRLIVPITADKLNAERQSLLYAEFRSEVEEGNEEDAYIEFQPSGQVRGADDPLKGMQKCRVTIFDWPPIYQEDWHDSILDAIQKRIADSVRVYMKNYKQKHKTIVETL